jgi:hypothetical protein
MKYSVKVTNDDLSNLRDGFLAINNSFCLVMSDNDEIKVDTWPGAGGTYFTDNPQLDNASSGDEIEITLPGGNIKYLTLPYNI